MKTRIEKAEKSLEKARKKVEQLECQMFKLDEKKRARIWKKTRIEVLSKLDEVRLKLKEAYRKKTKASLELMNAKEEINNIEAESKVDGEIEVETNIKTVEKKF
jgi:hypothetical protein